MQKIDVGKLIEEGLEGIGMHFYSGKSANDTNSGEPGQYRPALINMM